MSGNVTLKAVFSTDKSFEIQITGSQFRPNEKYWFGIFYPDGSPGGAIGIISNELGNLCLPDGTDNIHHGSISTHKIQTGKYRAVVADPDSEFSARIFYPGWKEIHVKKISADFPFDIPFQNESSIEVEFQSEVPWGTSYEIAGRLCIKDKISNFQNFLGNKHVIIKNDNKTFTGFTSELGHFSKFVEVNDDVENYSDIQVEFEGDLHFSGVESKKISYNKIKHTTKMYLDNNNESFFEVIGSQKSLFNGRLLDIDFKKGLAKKKIIVRNMERVLESTETDDFGCFSFEISLPNYTGSYEVEMCYNGDKLLKSTNLRTQFNIKEKQQSSLLNTFFEFAISKKDFTNINKEPEHKNYITLLLTFLDFRAINLGFRGHDGEQMTSIVGNPSADLICTNGKGLYLVLDCTLYLPNDDKINRIFTTAKFILRKTGKCYLPIIITAKQMIKGKNDSQVVILDSEDINIIHHEIFKNKNLQRAKNSLESKIDVERIRKCLFAVKES